MDDIHSSVYCPTCACFRDGFLEFVSSSGRKYYFRFLCSFCLIPSQGVMIAKRKLRKP